MKQKERDVEKGLFSIGMNMGVDFIIFKMMKLHCLEHCVSMSKRMDIWISDRTA